MTLIEMVAAFGGPPAVVGVAKYLADRVAAHRKAIEARLDALEEAHAECLERERAGLVRTAMAMRRAVQLALMPRDPRAPPPATLPPPEYDEDTISRNMRTEIESALLDAELAAYTKKSTPPKGVPAPRKRIPSRPF